MQTVVGNLVIINATTGLPVSDRNMDFGATGEWEIWQCVKYILITAIRDVCLDRYFGLNFIMVDKPMPIAQIMLTQEIMMKINLFEDRCTFLDVVYKGDGVNGRLDPEVKIQLLVSI